MRAYTVATAAVALQVQPKWLDNVLSHHNVPGVRQSRQGVTRRLTEEAVIVLEITLRLCRSTGMPARTAITLATQMTRTGAGTHQLARGIAILHEIDDIRADLARRLSDAVEFAPTPRRGRRPRRQ